MTTLARIRTAILDPGTLARFAGGLPWRSILTLGDGHSKNWWRHALAEAEDRGMLEWDRERGCWTLTDAGRVAVRGVS